MFYRTFTNRNLDITNLSPDDIDIRDIAFSLSKQIRYAGHIYENYTVADHSIYMAKHFMGKGEYKNALHALLHDSTEAYISDIPSPVKAVIPQIREFENTIYAIIAEKFNLDEHLPDDVELMDKAMIPIEIKNFFDRDWVDTPEIKVHNDTSYQTFLDLYEEIMENLNE